MKRKAESSLQKRKHGVRTEVNGLMGRTSKPFIAIRCNSYVINAAGSSLSLNNRPRSQLILVDGTVVEVDQNLMRINILR
jgi:hypothetical protein